MSAKVENIETNKVKLTIEVTAEKFEEGMKAAYKKNVKKINMPGFRRGKAPRMLIEKTYGPDIFYEDAINEVLPDSYEAAIDETKIEPVSRPEIDVDQVEKGKPFIYTATVIVKPEVEIDGYKGISVNKVEYTVSDKDVDAKMKEMQDQNSRLVSVEDKPVKNGDTAIIDFEGFSDGEAFEGGKGENFNLVIGSGQFIPGFEDQLIGKKAGEETEVNVTFPEEYHAKDLAGKPAVFKVKINEVKEKVLPELDDEFAKDVSEFETLDELKADTKKKLEEEAEQKTKAEKENNVLEAVSGLLKAEIPDVMYENQIDSMIKDFSMRIQAQGLDLKTYLSYIGMDEETMRKSFREDAEKRLKTNLAVEKIMKLEKIEATDEDVEKEIEKMAENYKMEADKIKGMLNMDDLKEDLAMRKTIDFLIENAKFTKAASKSTTKKTTAKKDSETKEEEPKKTTAKKTTTTKKTTTAKKTASKKTEKAEDEKKDAE